MTYDQAKRQAIANADYFQHPYYVVSTSDSYRAERDPPSAENSHRIMYTAQPATVRCTCAKSWVNMPGHSSRGRDPQCPRHGDQHAQS